MHFAEEALMEIEQCTRLSHIQSMASYAYLVEEGMGEPAVYLCFKLPETIKSQKLPKHEQQTSSWMPCCLDKMNCEKLTAFVMKAAKSE